MPNSHRCFRILKHQRLNLRTQYIFASVIGMLPYRWRSQHLMNSNVFEIMNGNLGLVKAYPGGRVMMGLFLYYSKPAISLMYTAYIIWCHASGPLIPFVDSRRLSSVRGITKSSSTFPATNSSSNMARLLQLHGKIQKKSNYTWILYNHDNMAMRSHVMINNCVWNLIFGTKFSSISLAKGEKCSSIIC